MRQCTFWNFVPERLLQVCVISYVLVLKNNIYLILRNLSVFLEYAIKLMGSYDLEMSLYFVIEQLF